MSNRFAHQNSTAAVVPHGGPCDAPIIQSACSTSLLNRLSDRSTYGTLVADACEFNRGLSRSRASRLPFVDLATRTTQRPAPWLYRPQCDRFKETVDGGTHIVLRYLRHRWRLDNPPLSRRRKSAADRLWYTLQTGLNALGVPVDLVPLVTKRAYAIAGLPIPAVLAATLDATFSKQGSSQLANGSLINTAPVSFTGRNTTLNMSTAGSKRFFNAPDPHSIDYVRKTQQVRGEEELDVVAEDATAAAAVEEMVVPKLISTRLRPNDEMTPIASSEDSGQSNETSGLKRGASLGSQALVGAEEENKTDDETSVQSATGTKFNSNSDELSRPLPVGCAVNKSCELEPELVTEEDDEEEEEQPGDEDDEEEDDFDDDLDDVEWMQSGRRKSGRSTFATRRAFTMSRSQRSLTAHKGGRYTAASSRLSGRHITTASRNLGVRQKPRTSRTDLISIGARRATRSAAPPLGNKSFPVASFSATATLGRDHEKHISESWDKMDEPGFQPNANLSSLIDRADEPHRLLTDHLNSSNNLYSSNNSPIVHPLSTSETVPLLCDSSSRGSPASFADRVRRHMQTVLSSVPTCSGCQSTSSTHPVNTTHLQSKSSTMVQLLATNTTVSSTSNPNYNYNTVISSESNVRETAAHTELHTQPGTSDWIGSPSAVSQSTTKLLKDTMSGLLPGGRSVLDYPVTDQSSPSRVGNAPGDQFATPTGATTTVTFFVCEVCASRYRSTAGLRYHYHSQHSGYTPKSPISASASRLVVPVGEERGIGGGLRGGRPRRNKAGNMDVRGRNKMKDVDLKTYGDANLGLGAIRTGASEQTTGNDGADAFREPGDPNSTFSPNYLSNGGSNRIPSEPSPNRPFMRSATYSPKHPNGMIDEGLKTGQLTSGSIATPLTSMGLMASGFSQLPNNSASTTTVSGLVEATAQRLHQTQPTSSGIELTASSMARSRTPSSSPLVNTIPSVSYGAVPWAGADHPYPPPPTSSQQGSLDLLPSGLSSYTYSTSQQRRYERQHCADRINPGRVPMRSEPHCVYCLGDERLNPRIARAENLLRCYRCAQWAHFSCLRLPQHVIEAALRYPWQCILCKTCWLCGSPEQELRMVFCGDCDRAFHVDCLPAPLPRIPDGSWSCDICLHEIYAMGKSTIDNNNNKFSAATDSSYYLLKDQ